jgi:hypothetical protein
MKDPADPTRMRAAWMHDCYHPNAIGDQKMADAVDLSVFGLGAWPLRASTTPTPEEGI